MDATSLHIAQHSESSKNDSEYTVANHSTLEGWSDQYVTNLLILDFTPAFKL